MSYRLPYQPTAAPPHMPLDHLRRRLAPYLAPADADGHVGWLGARGDGEGLLRVRRPIGATTLAATRLVWAAAGRGWLAPPGQVRRACGRPLCVAVDHLRAVAAAELRQLTDAQVYEARALYWSQGRCRHGRRVGLRSRADAAQHTAWRLGISRATVLRVIDGQPVRAHLWQTNGVDAEAVRRTHAEMDADAAALADEEVVTQRQLAARYGLSVACMARLLAGVSYAHVPMPARDEGRARPGAGREPPERIVQELA